MMTSPTGDNPLTNLPVELLVFVAGTLGNPLALLVSKAHLSKAFRAAACAAQPTLSHADLRRSVLLFSLYTQLINPHLPTS
jgi:hypothetical protein